MTPKQLNLAFQNRERERAAEARERLSAEVPRLARIEAAELSGAELDELDELLRLACVSRSDFCATLVPFAKADELRRRIDREDEPAIVERRHELEADCERIKAERDKAAWLSPEWSQKNSDLRAVENKLNGAGFSLTQLKTWRRELASLEAAYPEVKTPTREFSAAH